MLPSPSSLESAYRSTPSTFACTDVKSPLWEEAMSLVARMTSIYSMLALWKIMQQCKQYAQNTRRYSAAFGVTETAETDFRISLFPFVDLGECNWRGLESASQFQVSFIRSKSAFGGPEL